MATNHTRMSLLLDKDSLAKLNVLARQNTISKCAYIRALISRAAQMEINLIPTCSDGRRCLCPQIHGHAPTPQAVRDDPLTTPH